MFEIRETFGHWGYEGLELYALYRNHWTMNERPEHVREIKLPKESEFRFELEAGTPMAIRVRSKSVPKHCPSGV